MNFQYPLLVQISLGVLALIVVIQSLILIIVMLNVRKQLHKLQPMIRKLTSTAGQLLDVAELLLSGAEQLSEKLPAMETGVARISETVEHAIKTVDQNADLALDFLRSGLTQADHRMDSLLSHFSHTTFKVHKAVVNPAHTASAALQAVQSTISFYFFRDSHKPPVASADKQIFI